MVTLATELGSAGISIATGLVVALLIQAAYWLRMRMRRRASESSVRAVFQDFEREVREARGSDDGALTREGMQFALWTAHLDTARLVASAHSPNLKQVDFLELMKVIDGWVRISRMLADNRKVPGSKIYDNYFAELRPLTWLELEESTP